MPTNRSRPGLRKARTRPVAAVATAAAVVAAIALHSGAPAAAETTAGGRALETRLVAAATGIDRATDHGRASGYAGLGIDDKRVTVWWKGDLPTTVRTAVTEARRTVAVQVVAAKHSRAELRAAAKGVIAYVRANPDAGYYGVTIASDGGRMVVYAEPAAGRFAAAAPPAAMKIPARIQASVAERPRAQAAAGRLSDFPPYYGGGRIQNNDNSGFCTAGFAVKRKNVAYMLTAGHCGRLNTGFNNGDDSLAFGTVAMENDTHDLLLVQANATPTIFVEPAGAPTAVKSHQGSMPPFTGLDLCTSGSVGGNVCNFETGFDFEFSYCDEDVYGVFQCFENLVLADQIDGLPGAIPGDSGGPVYHPDSGPVVAIVGTISGVWNSQVIFQDYETARLDFGLKLF